MLLNITQNKVISDVQKDFNRAYPFLKIDFYKLSDPQRGTAARTHINNTLSIKNAGLISQGDLEISDALTVGQLEKTFRDQFGLYVQVSRKSGSLWLETTISDSWTLKQQNDHGKELSEPQKNNLTPDQIDYS
jgi:hypothetical protein